MLASSLSCKVIGGALICHFHVPRNAMNLFLLFISIVSHFSWDQKSSLEKLKTKRKQKTIALWGTLKTKIVSQGAMGFYSFSFQVIEVAAHCSGFLVFLLPTILLVNTL